MADRDAKNDHDEDVDVGVALGGRDQGAGLLQAKHTLGAANRVSAPTPSSASGRGGSPRPT